MACLCKINGFCARSVAFVQHRPLLCKNQSTRSRAGDLGLRLSEDVYVCARSDAFVQDLKLLCKIWDFCAICNGREVASRLAKKSANVACLCRINGYCARSGACVQNQ